MDFLFTVCVAAATDVGKVSYFNGNVMRGNAQFNWRGQRFDFSLLSVKRGVMVDKEYLVGKF